MEETKLRHELSSVVKNGYSSYGGSQRFSDNKIIQSSGCGLTAALELFLYMHKYIDGCRSMLFAQLPSSGSLQKAEYSKLLSSLTCYFPLIPNYGINGLMLTMGINAFFIRNSYPYKAIWGMSRDRLWERTQKMLEQDIPVIISVGPNLSFARQKYKTDMFTTDAFGQKRRSTGVCAHYMIVTAIDSEWITVSSWGRKYYINCMDYMIYSKHHSGSVLSNIVYITKK